MGYTPPPPPPMPKTYSFGVTFKTDPKHAAIAQGMQDSIQKAVKKAQRDLAHSFLKNQIVQLPPYVYEWLSCPDDDAWESHHHGCKTCNGRDRHPMPMSELYGLGKLIET